MEIFVGIILSDNKRLIISGIMYIMAISDPNTVLKWVIGLHLFGNKAIVKLASRCGIKILTMIS